jgi:hypothetical protein
MDSDIFLDLMSLTAPDWLLGSRVYTRVLHFEENIDPRTNIFDSFFVGAKDLWLIKYNKGSSRARDDTSTIEPPMTRNGYLLTQRPGYTGAS